jgi:hypothetical protein
MLPGFRFLLAAILLSTSILVFGLGAAALLRATHEQFVSNPPWRNGPQEQVFAQAPEPVQPVLAALRAEPVVTEPLAAEPAPSLRDRVPTISLPASEPELSAAVTTEASVSPQPQVTEAPPIAVAADEPAEVETTEIATQAAADTLTPLDTMGAVLEAKPTPATSEPAPADNSAAQASSALDIASTRVAALNDPATTAWRDPPAKPKAANIAPASKAAKPRAHRAKKRHRIVRRPPPQQLQQSFDPFGQQPTQTANARTQ